MKQRQHFPVFALTALALFASAAGAGRAQEGTTVKIQTPEVFAGQGDPTYSDEFANSCEKNNTNNPYAGINPLVCYGVSAPADSAGKCSLSGMTVIKQEGSTCYYCQRINPPIEGFIVAMDIMPKAEQQGFSCGVDQAAPNCYAVCQGNGTFKPPAGTSGPPPPPPPPPPPAEVQTNCSQGSSALEPSFADYLLQDAQTELQNAGKVSKAMTDAMDVTKHNDVGIKVGASSAATVACGVLFGAAANYMTTVAQQFKLLAAARCVNTAEQSAVVQIANDAAADSTTVANEATQSVSRLPTTGGGVMGGPDAAGYMEGISNLTAVNNLQQGPLPTCAVLSCVRLAQLLKSNISIFRMLQNMKPNLIVSIGEKGAVTVKGGLTGEQVAQGLTQAGLKAQYGTGMTNMMNQVRAGKPVIAGMYTSVCSGSAPLHAVVVEGIETVGDQSVLRIYDPVGWVYTQPVVTFQKYFTGEFVMPL